MKKIFYSAIAAALVSSSLSAQVIDIQNGWQLLGAKSTIDLETAFSSSCVKSVFEHENGAWKTFVPGGSKDMKFIPEGKGFWVNGNGICTVDTTSIATASKKAVKSVEFIGMDYPKTTDKMKESYSEAKAKVTYADGTSTESALSYNILFTAGTKIGTNEYEAGRLYDKNMKGLNDHLGKPLIAETPDSNSLLKLEDGSLNLVTHFEYDWLLSDGSDASKNSSWSYSRAPMSMTLTSISQDATSGKLTATAQKPINFSSVNGLWIPCFGSQTPWNTHLGSEEDYDLYFTAASGSSNYAATQAGLKAMNALYFNDVNGTNAKAYYYGFFPEVTVKPGANYSIAKHYSMGRGTWEAAKVLPDRRTAYYGDDGTNVALFMYVADKAEDLSAGTLYASKWTQTNESGAKDGGKATLSWIKLGHATDAQIKEMTDKYTFADIFDAKSASEYNASIHTGYTAIKAGHSNIEYLKLKSGMEQAAAFLESRRYAAIKGATTEFNKMEGVAFNRADNKLYLAMSYIDKGMKSDSSFATDHIKIAKNNCGGTYELTLAGNQTDSDGNPIDSGHVATSMLVPSALLGEEIAKDSLGNTCNPEKIANTDNIFFSDKMRTLFIGEDSGTHVNNFVWAYNIDTKKLSRILSVVAGGESTGLQVLDNVNGFGYVMSNSQHHGDYISTMDANLSAQLDAANAIQKTNAGNVGYISGIPGL